MAIFKSQKHAFWQALVVALIFFNLGIFFGYILERNRIQKIDELYALSELESFDIKAQGDLLSLGEINCNSAIESNIKFANKIYDEAKLLQKYEDASRLTGALILRHKRYDLLRTQLWINSLILKKNCSAKFHNIVYLYEYADGNAKIEIKAEQNVLSRLLSELKEKYGDTILLIPIAGDNDFESINMLMKSYNVTKLPTILIDEKIKIETIEQAKEIEKYLK